MKIINLLSGSCRVQERVQEGSEGVGRSESVQKSLGGSSTVQAGLGVSRTSLECQGECGRIQAGLRGSRTIREGP